MFSKARVAFLKLRAPQNKDYFIFFYDSNLTSVIYPMIDDVSKNLNKRFTIESLQYILKRRLFRSAALLMPV